MLTATADQLRDFASELLTAAGVPEVHAQTVASYLVRANLEGHDSHGVIRLLRYLPLIEEGKIDANAVPEVLSETDTTVVVDGHWGLGFVVTSHTAALVADKAVRSGVAAATIRRQSHLGRLGWYTAQVAQHGLIGFAAADSGQAPKSVAPYGGRERRLGTNPLSFAIPSNGEPVVFDIATSTVAHGKIRVAAARGESIPLGWVVDADGHDTTDPTAMERGGALLPFGADQGHKGYGLSFVVEVLAGLLTGIGFSHDPGGFSNDGTFLAAFSVDRFRDLGIFTSDLQDFIDYLKATPRSVGHQEILYPGELEQRCVAERTKAGIRIEERTWERLTDYGKRLGVQPFSLGVVGG